jgi:enoyl-CoA hydratase
LTLDDPQSANALSPALVSRLQAALDAACAHNARALVFTSSSRSFCAGFDLRDADRADDPALRERFAALERLLESVRRAPALTLASVRGPALGAGADLVAACDYRLGTAEARFGFPGIRLGVILGTRHLRGLVGGQRAREILLEGKTLDAEQALAAGLLSDLCPPERLDGRIDEILAHSRALDEEALRALLRLTREAASERDLEELLRSTARPGLADRVRAHAHRVLK